jgi:lysozyme family protein
MPSVEEVAAQIVAREGGYVNDPDDPGGATNYGVTVGTMKSLGLDLNKDGRVDANDVKMLTRAQAQQIFVEHYFRRPRLAELPPAVQASVSICM